MFFRIRLKDANTAEDGRSVSEHWQEHISWCLDLVINNSPDTPEVMDHMYKTCVTWVGRPKDEEYFAGDASYNAFMAVLRRPKGLWEEYCTQKQKNWLENFDLDYI